MNQKEQNMTRKNFSSQDAPVVYLQAWLGGGLTRDHRETNNPDASLMLVWEYVRAGLEPRTSGLRARYADHSVIHPPRKNIPTTLIWNKTKLRYVNGPKKPLNLVIVTLSVFVSSFLVKS